MPFVNQSSVALPVGVPAPPVTLMKSCTVEPAATTVTVPCASLWISVETAGFCFTTWKHSFKPASLEPSG